MRDNIMKTGIDKIGDDSERKYRQLFAAMSEGVAVHEIIYDDSGRATDYMITDVNPAFESIVGLKKEVVVGKKATEAYGSGEPPYLDVYARTAATGEPTSFETYFPPMDKYFSISVFSPEMGKFATIFSDVSERKRSEDRQKQYLEETQAQVQQLREQQSELEALNLELHRLNRELRAISDCHQSIIRANDEQSLLKDVCHIICEVAGYRMAWVGIKENDDNKSVRPVAWGGVENEYLATAKITWADSERGNGPTGLAARTEKTHFFQDFVTDLNAAPWRDAALARGFRSSIGLPLLGNNGAAFGVFTLYAVQPNGFNPYEIQLLEKLASDLAFGISVLRLRADRDQAEEGLRRRTAELEISNKELEAFSYSVSHDLRAPLRRLDGFSQIILEDYGDKLDAQCQEYLSNIRSSSHLMAKLIDDILILSRVTRTTINWGEINLSDLAEEVEIELRKTRPERQVEFRIQSGLEASGDRNLLKLVLDNLLGNAYKFTGKCTQPVIEFGAKSDGGQTVYFVRDNGAGFDMAYADKLFKPFQRLHSVEEYPGTGIGLASAQRIIHRHGGQVWAEGEKGKGAVFHFTLSQKNN